ncbi:MAG: NUDIX hydrolase [Deltaproteobacteria bacterium]|nr:NUDIX hydrolase [Deltaproteobacteria bacterium]
MKREYPEAPIAGVGGVIFQNDAVLLVKRDKEPGKGQWSLPGGAVELGEPLIDALKRELHEEVSIKVRIGGLVRVLDRIVHDQDLRIRFHYVIVDYWGVLLSGPPRAGSDISDARFVSMGQARDMGAHEEVLETVRMAVEMRNQISS